MTSARLPVFDRRRSGVLLPMSALEAALGRGGRAFIDWLPRRGVSGWEILSGGPVGRGSLALLGALGPRGEPRVHRPGGAARPGGSHRSGVPRGLRLLAARLRAVRGADARARRGAVLDVGAAVARSRARGAHRGGERALG